MNQEEHAYKIFQKMLKAHVYPSAMLLYGPEDYLIQWAVDELTKELIHPSVAAMDAVIFSEGDASVSELIAACETLPLFSARRLVIVEDADFFAGGKSRRYGPAEQSELAAYLRSMPESTMLLFKCAGVDKRTSAYKAIREHGMALEFSPISGQILKGFIQKKLMTMGKTASSQTIGSLIERTGYGDKNSEYTLHHLMNDLIKAASYSLEPEIKSTDFEAVTTASPQSDVFQLLEAAFSGKKGLALKLFQNRLSGLLSSDADREVFQLIALLCSQLELMLIARERLEAGQVARELPGVMGVHPFRLRKAVETAGSRSVVELSDSLAAAYRLEKDIKSGLMPADLAMELFIAMV
ncbi:MAG TPA: DNA polymerase III subunit delta [Clostridiales bacterium]|nr:DNA polymerase III subunit delta [Clostridiales bacterium]